MLNGYYYWIGLSDSAMDGTWRWLNGNRANRDDGSLWHPGHPRTGSSGNNRDCAVAFFNENIYDELSVYDAPCSNNYRVLCEKPV